MQPTRLSRWYVRSLPLYVRVGVRDDLFIASFWVYVIVYVDTMQSPSSPSPFECSGPCSWRRGGGIGVWVLQSRWLRLQKPVPIHLVSVSHELSPPVYVPWNSNDPRRPDSVPCQYSVSCPVMSTTYSSFPKLWLSLDFRLTHLSDWSSLSVTSSTTSQGQVLLYSLATCSPRSIFFSSATFVSLESFSKCVEQFVASMYLVPDLVDKYPQDSLTSHILDVVVLFLSTLLNQCIHRDGVRP